MKKILFYSIIFSFLFAYAQGPDAIAITKQGNARGAVACMTCHGSQGEGMAAAGFPYLAQLPAAYITEQLKDYADDVRVNSVMGPIAKALSVEERTALAEYYSSLKLTKFKAPKGHVNLIAQGKKLATVGDQKLQVQACANCHGPGGSGHYMYIPSLAGQPAAYIESQLLAWKKGERKNSVNQMLPVAKNLDEKSIKALSEFFAQIHPVTDPIFSQP
ncbi:MAG: cytochrome c4 [Bdellovibrio sp.]|nr:cytochrome c4 [Bdellovibrio sp.]